MVRFCGAGNSEGGGVSSNGAEVEKVWDYLCGLWGMGGTGGSQKNLGGRGRVGLDQAGLLKNL